MAIRFASFMLVLVILGAPAASAQSFDLSANFIAAQWSEFDETDLGVGGRLAWKPSPAVGLEGELNWYPSDFPGERLVFTGNRVEGLGAVTAGPRLGRLRPFARLGAGFLRVSPAPAPFACIAIFPPPLHCLLGAGDTLPAIEIGGGVEIATSDRTFLRFDAVDRILRYPGPTFGPADEISEQGFFGHAFKFSFGGGWRF